DAMRRHGVDKMIFSSTCATYGVPLEMPLTESHPQAPINPYGWTKLMIERAMLDYGQAYGLRSVALRYFNAAGADPEGRVGERHDPETHLIPLTLFAALDQGREIRIFGTDYDTPDGTCIRDYIHVTDLAQAHVLAYEYLADGGETQAFNLGNGQGFSVREVIDCARRVSGREIRAVEDERRPGDPPRLIGSSEKIIATLGWAPKYAGLERILQTAWDWHCKDR
ncbi:MAG: UDP-glucose 4-epimerase GalE, partial [Desulfovibrionaceae bacterium]